MKPLRKNNANHPDIKFYIYDNDTQLPVYLSHKTLLLLWLNLIPAFKMCKAGGHQINLN